MKLLDENKKIVSAYFPAAQSYSLIEIGHPSLSNILYTIWLF